MASRPDPATPSRLMTLKIARSRILLDLQTACHPNHRATLEQSLAVIEAELRTLDVAMVRAQ